MIDNELTAFVTRAENTVLDAADDMNEPISNQLAVIIVRDLLAFFALAHEAACERWDKMS